MMLEVLLSCVASGEGLEVLSGIASPSKASSSHMDTTLPAKESMCFHKQALMCMMLVSIINPARGVCLDVPSIICSASFSTFCSLFRFFEESPTHHTVLAYVMIGFTSVSHTTSTQASETLYI